MERSFNPGNFRFKINFLQPSTTKDDYGERVDTWSVFKTGIWASKEPLLGNEYLTSLTTDTKVEVKFRLRYIDGITNSMRIQHGSEIYEILSAINVKSLNHELLCYCKLIDRAAEINTVIDTWDDLAGKTFLDLKTKELI